jgi:hypothetical protein
MPRLIEIDKSKEKKVTHGECGAVIGYFLNEVQKGTYTDYGGGTDAYYFIICPNCGKKIEVNKY